MKYCRPSTSWETEWKIFKKCLLWDFSICSVSCPYEKGFPCSSHSNIVCPLKTRVVYSVKNSFCSIQGFMEEHVLPSNAWAMSFSLVINHLHHISQYTGNIDLWPEGLILGKGIYSGGCFLPVHVFKVSRFFKETWSGHLATITFGTINFLNTSDSLLAKSKS